MEHAALLYDRIMNASKLYNLIFNINVPAVPAREAVVKSGKDDTNRLASRRTS